jgi:hypothetical protein
MVNTGKITSFLFIIFKNFKKLIFLKNIFLPSYFQKFELTLKLFHDPFIFQEVESPYLLPHHMPLK